MNLIVKFFDELTTRELYEIVRARTEIFLLEQKIICQDFDGVDYDSLHCFLEETVKIGRVLSLTHGIGLGKELLNKSIPEIKRKLNCNNITLHSQKHAQGFYEKLGFTATSPDFIEEGIPHVAMKLEDTLS